MRRGIGVAFFLSLLLLSLLWPVSPAAAHAGFESSEPADGTTTNTEVAEIVLRFSSAADPVGEGFVILASSGVLRMPDSATPNEDKTSWTLVFEPPIGGGIVGVRWTVQAPDAHPINGSFSFTVDAPATATAPFEQEESATDQRERANTPTTATAAEPDDASTEAEALASTSPTRAVDPPTGDTIELDDFLSAPADSAANAQAVATLGSLLRLAGTALTIGGLIFVFHVLRGRPTDALFTFAAVRYTAVTIALGATIDLVARLAMANSGWATFWSNPGIEAVGLSTHGFAIGLQIGAGVLLFATASSNSKRLASTGRSAPQRDAVLAGGSRPDGWLVSLDEDPTRGGRDTDLVIDQDTGTGHVAGAVSMPSVIAAGVVLLLASFAFDGHTATEGNRWLTAAVDIVHVGAGSIWAGGVVFFAAVLWRRHRHGRQLNALEVAVRFSVVAGAALAVAGLAGTVLAVIILDSIGELWSTSWGRLLIAKCMVVVAAASMGAYNHFVALPRLADKPADEARSIRLRNTISVEAAMLVVVVMITAFLVGASAS